MYKLIIYIFKLFTQIIHKKCLRTTSLREETLQLQFTKFIISFPRSFPRWTIQGLTGEAMLGTRFSLFGSGGGGSNKVVDSSRDCEVLPRLKLQTDKNVYRPGDALYITIEIGNPLSDNASLSSLLMESLALEIKGIEKLDTQWFATQKPLPRSKQRRG